MSTGAQSIIHVFRTEYHLILDSLPDCGTDIVALSKARERADTFLERLVEVSAVKFTSLCSKD